MDEASWEEISARVRREQERRRAAVAGHRDLVRQVSAALYRLDPIGIAFGDNLDEYDSEADIIVEHLLGGTAGVEAVRTLVHRVLVEQFDADLAGSPADLGELPAEIWAKAVESGPGAS